MIGRVNSADEIWTKRKSKLRKDVNRKIEEKMFGVVCRLFFSLFLYCSKTMAFLFLFFYKIQNLSTIYFLLVLLEFLMIELVFLRKKI